jgi:hypothetical protein
MRHFVHGIQQQKIRYLTKVESYLCEFAFSKNVHMTPPPPPPSSGSHYFLGLGRIFFSQITSFPLRFFIGYLTSLPWTWKDLKFAVLPAGSSITTSSRLMFMNPSESTTCRTVMTGILRHCRGKNLKGIMTRDNIFFKVLKIKTELTES